MPEPPKRKAPNVAEDPHIHSLSRPIVGSSTAVHNTLSGRTNESEKAAELLDIQPSPMIRGIRIAVQARHAPSGECGAGAISDSACRAISIGLVSSMSAPKCEIVPADNRFPA
jgi:hypothetical protein